MPDTPAARLAAIRALVEGPLRAGLDQGTVVLAGDDLAWLLDRAAELEEAIRQAVIGMEDAEMYGSILDSLQDALRGS